MLFRSFPEETTIASSLLRLTRDNIDYHNYIRAAGRCKESGRSAAHGRWQRSHAQSTAGRTILRSTRLRRAHRGKACTRERVPAPWAARRPMELLALAVTVASAVSVCAVASERREVRGER